MSEERWDLRRSAGKVAAVVACLAAVALTAGCGGSDKPKASTPASASTTAAADPVVADAKKLLEAIGGPIQWKAPGPSLDAAKIKGRKVQFVAIDLRIPVIADAAKGAQEAATAMGLSLTLVDAKSNPSAMVQGVETGIQQADAIVLDGIPLELIQKQVAAATAAKKPVVSAFNNPVKLDQPGQGAGAGIYANVSMDPYESGVHSAAQAIADTGGKARVAIFTDPTITPAKYTVQGIKDELAKCSGCSVSSTVGTPTAEWATAISGKAASAVQQDPKVNYILPIYDGMASFVVAGLGQAGANGRVKVASADGTPAVLKMIQDGGPMVGDEGQPTPWVGWQAIDSAARGILGLAAPDGNIPVRWLDKANLAGADVNDEAAVYGNPPYKQQFKALWGVK